ncbi:pyridoxal phosphate-dependent transferase [Powellomyces hirtus]|nr:pyridoxal phosphate-dependent transferase [Powellomyces hirtus]
MGKGKRAHFDSSRPPISSADIMHKPAGDDHHHTPPALYRGTTTTTAHDGGDPNAALEKSTDHLIEDTPIGVLITTYMSYFFLIIFGHIRDFFGMRFKKHEYRHLQAQNGYASLSSGFDTFYHRRLYMRIRDVFNRPITKVPGRTVHLLDRETNDFNKTYTFTGKTTEVLNLASYNYLGFAQSEGPCADAVEASVRKWGVGTCSSRMEAGTFELHLETEALVARFIGTEDSMIVSMGFATNSTTIPALVQKGCLILSDELNHSSLIYGARISGATIKTFKHNDSKDLEAVLRKSIAHGQPRTHRPWKKILIIVEGLYSMEGSICALPEIVALKKKYKTYLYLDEAHSIGAMGPNGRGICDYFGVDPADVDIMMGTFTKSFGASGGYIAGRKDIIDVIRLHNYSSVYSEAITPPVLQQIHTSLRIISGEEGGDEGRTRIAQLARNARFFSQGLRNLGFIVYGDMDSPVVPLLLFHPAKIPAFSREMLKRGIAVVVVGYPATPIITSRVRFCLSAAHTIEDLTYALQAISDIGDEMVLKVSSRPRPAIEA